MITLFKSINTTNSPFHVTLESVLQTIKDGKQKDLIEKIRTIKDKTDRNVLKKKLHCILFSGEFTKRSIKGLQAHSGLMCLDFDGFDNKEDMAAFKEFAVEDVYTNALFESPSGNGYKLIVKIPTTDHLGSFLALQDHYNKQGWERYFDKSTKDVSRICYNSYDPNLFFNSDSEAFTEITEQKIVTSKTKGNLIKMDNQNAIISNLIKWWDKDYGFVQGEKNNNLFLLASAFNQFGVDKYLCTQYFLANYFQPPCKDPLEITNLVDNAYNHSEDFNTKSFEDRDAVKEIERMSHTGTSAAEISKRTGVSIEEVEEVIDSAEKNVFWSVSDKGAITTDMLRYKYFLENNGYYKYKGDDSDEFVFVKVKNNLIENTTEIDMKNFVLGYLEKISDKSIYQHFASRNTLHFTESSLNMISNVKVNLRLDSKSIGFVYYKNCAVKVTPTNVELVDYIDLDGAVWRSHVIDRDYDIVEEHENDYKQFVRNISKDGREDVVKSAESALGYLMHNYNDRKTQKAIILNDSKQSGNAEEGGIGKGLFVQGVDQIRRMVIEDGKDFDDKGTFKYQRVGLDTQVFSFDDVPRDFKFEKLFSIITEGMTVTKKNETAVKLKYSDSPKIVITTNYVIKGRGNSHDRRKFEIEFGEYYGGHFSPFDDFKKELFNDWDDEHFNRFDNYMVSLIQKYMVTGLVASKSDTAEKRKLVATTDEFFIGFMDDMVDTLSTYQDYLILHQKCKDESGLPNLMFREFVVWLKDYALHNHYKLESMRDKGSLLVKMTKSDVEFQTKIKDGTEF